MLLPDARVTDRPAVSLDRLFPLDEALVAQWRALHERLYEENIYLSPGFAIPALRHLGGGDEVQVLRVHDGRDGLLALGLFTERRCGLRHPFRVLSAYKSPHTFLTGWLLDRARAGEAMAALRDFLVAQRFRWSGIEFRDLDHDSRVAGLMRESFLTAASWFELDRTTRACIDFDQGEGVAAAVSGKRKLIKNLQRCRRNLEATGAVEWRFVTGAAIDATVVETFLRLEHAGWKGEAGTSLLAKPGHREFFDGMIAALGRDNVFFTELAVDGRVIASTCNLAAQRTGFAFKVAWDPEYARFSPGVINEYEFLVDTSGSHARFDHIDSGAVAGSYIDKLWPDRKAITDGIFVFNPLARAWARGMTGLRAIRRALRKTDKD